MAGPADPDDMVSIVMRPSRLRDVVMLDHPARAAGAKSDFTPSIRPLIYQGIDRQHRRSEYRLTLHGGVGP